MNEQQAAKLFFEAFQAHTGHPPTPHERQAIQSVSRLETNHGEAPPFAGSNNFGAVQCCKPKDGQCPDGSFLHKDSSPTAQGTSVSYAVCFRKYDSPEKGARHLVQLLTTDRPGVAKVLASGDARAIAAAMYDSHYYQGFGATREARIDGYAKAIARNAAAIGAALGEGVLVTLASSPTKPPSGGGGGGGAEAGAFALGMLALVLLWGRRLAPCRTCF